MGLTSRLHGIDLITMAAMGAVGLGVYEANPGTSFHFHDQPRLTGQLQAVPSQSSTWMGTSHTQSLRTQYVHLTDGSTGQSVADIDSSERTLSPFGRPRSW